MGFTEILAATVVVLLIVLAFQPALREPPVT